MLRVMQEDGCGCDGFEKKGRNSGKKTEGSKLRKGMLMNWGLWVIISWITTMMMMSGK